MIVAAATGLETDTIDGAVHLWFFQYLVDLILDRTFSDVDSLATEGTSLSKSLLVEITNNNARRA